MPAKMRQGADVPIFETAPPPPAFVPIVRQVALELQAIAAEQGLGCWVAASATLNSRRFKLAGTSKQLVRAGKALACMRGKA